MAKATTINRTSYEPKFIGINDARLRTILESVGLDLSFQRPESWNILKKKKFCYSLVNGRAPTPIVIVDVEKSLQQCLIGTEDFDYFKEWLDQGFKYISIDGNNRTVTLLQFFSGKISLPTGDIPLKDGKYATLNSSNNKWNTIPEDLQNEIFENISVSLLFFTVSSRKELSLLFTSINDGLGLNNQEKRNALVCKFAKEIRELAKQSTDALQYIYKKGNIRYGIDEFLVKMATFHAYGSSVETANKAALNAAYEDGPDGAGSNTYKDFMKSGKDTIKKSIRMVEKYGTSSFKNSSTLFNLFMTVYQINKDNKKIINEQEFFEWFTKTETHRLPKIAYTNKKGDTWSYETCGNNSKKLDYEARLNIIKKDLKLIPSTIVSMVDTNRTFSKSEKYKMWENQNGKCNICNKDCKESELYDSDLWHGDHVHAHSKGGMTVMENSQLLCAPCNLKKSNK
jgi:hypothetical protein|tara:strand:+ start:214 stop:1578 length:1365 start_codon:yes stop_codon:yes gene_type:complete